MRAEHVSILALVITLLGGGGGLGMTVSSNNAVVKKLEEVTLTLVDIRATMRANDADKVRMEAAIHENQSAIERLRAEVAEARQRLAIIESRQPR